MCLERQTAVLQHVISVKNIGLIHRTCLPACSSASRHLKNNSLCQGALGLMSWIHWQCVWQGPGTEAHKHSDLQWKNITTLEWVFSRRWIHLSNVKSRDKTWAVWATLLYIEKRLLCLCYSCTLSMWGESCSCLDILILRFHDNRTCDFRVCPFSKCSNSLLSLHL